jgi:hypothetical protein
MFLKRCSSLAALGLFLAAATAGAGDRNTRELHAAFIKIDGDTLWVTFDKDRPRDFPLSKDVELLRNGKPCKRDALQPKDELTLTIQIPDKANASPPRLIRVAAKGP